MCGVGGQLVASPVRDRELIEQTRRMVDAFEHRGPDGSGVWSDSECGVALGHRRLAVIDLSPTGAQPMTGASGRWTISFNGEIYNHRDLRATLVQQGVRFRGTSDTETLIEAFDAWGIEATLRRAEGMFAFAVWDRVDRSLSMARDRFGEKPLCWWTNGRRFAFASEVRGLATLDDFDRTIDEISVASMLSFGFVPSPRNIYRDVRQLRPGHLLRAHVQAGVIATDECEWWSLRDTVSAARAQRSTRATTASSMSAAVAELDEVMARSVEQRLQSDVPLGAFLSGGVDSSLVAALAQRALGATPLKTFTVKMAGSSVADGTDESETASRIAAHLGTDHTSVEISAADALAVVPTLAATWDEPFADPSMLPSLLLCRAASRSLTVCLSGDGGDEMFAGYNRHALGASLDRRTAWMPSVVRSGLGRALAVPSASTVDRLNAAAMRLMPAKWRVANLGDKVRKASAVLATDTARHGGDAGAAWAAFAGVWPRSAIICAQLEPGIASTATSPLTGDVSATEQMMWLDTADVLPDNMLVKVDRASMAASLEVHAPFLSPDVLDWSWRQPMDVKTAGGVGKLVVRQLVDTMIPPGIANRPKMGFDPPLAQWLRGPLREWADDLITSAACVEHGWLDGQALTDTWREHRDGRRDWTYRLWAVLMLEGWLAGATA